MNTESINNSREIRESGEDKELSRLVFSLDNLDGLIEAFYLNRIKRVLEAKSSNGKKDIKLDKFFTLLKKVNSRFSPGMEIKDQEEILKEEEDNIREINSKLFELGIVKVAETMEYKVNRRNSEVAKKMGIKSFPDLEMSLLEFYERYGIIKDENNSGKLISMSWGCGNAGGLLERRLQRESIAENGRNLSEYFEYFGCADSIYSSLDDLIYKFIKPEYQDKKKPFYREFVAILSTLILRAHRLADFEDKKNRNNDKKHSKTIFSNETRDKLKNVTNNMNFLRDIMFLLDEARVVHKNDVINGKRKFLADLEYSSEKVVEINNKSVVDLFKELANCYFDFNGDKHHDFENRVLAFVKKYFEEDFLNQSIDLNKYHKIHSHNVFLMDFQEAPKVFINSSQNYTNQSAHEPKLLNFHLVTAFRSNSHQKRENYISSLITLIEHLVPGGIILDDGDRESYTREEVLDELLEIQEAHPEIKIDVITKKSGKKLSLLIQKGIKKDDNLYFLDHNEKNKFVLEKKQILSLTEFKNKKIIQNYRSLIISVLKQIQIDDFEIRNNYFLKTNFFRNLNVPIDSKIIDFILQELVRYSLEYILKEKELLMNREDNHEESAIRLLCLTESLKMLLPRGDISLIEKITDQIYNEDDFNIDYLIDNIEIPNIKNSKDKSIKVKKMIFERILEIFKSRNIDISAQAIFDYIDEHNRQNHLIDTVENSPEIKYRVKQAESFIANYPFVISK